MNVRKTIGGLAVAAVLALTGLAVHHSLLPSATADDAGRTTSLAIVPDDLNPGGLCIEASAESIVVADMRLDYMLSWWDPLTNAWVLTVGGISDRTDGGTIGGTCGIPDDSFHGTLMRAVYTAYDAAGNARWTSERLLDVP